MSTATGTPADWIKNLLKKQAAKEISGKERIMYCDHLPIARNGCHQSNNKTKDLLMKLISVKNTFAMQQVAAGNGLTVSALLTLLLCLQKSKHY